MPTAALRSPPAVLLARDRRSATVAVDHVPIIDRAMRGAVAARPRAGVVRRAEPGPAGPLVLEALQRGTTVDVMVWGPAATPPDVCAGALDAARAWLGLTDQAVDLPDVVADRPALREAARALGEIRLSQLPRVTEAVGRAVLAQLVQQIEARRSTARVAALLGEPAGMGLWCWPVAQRLTRTPAHALRPCGVSLRSAIALHAGALDEAQLERVRRIPSRIERRLRAIRGIGPWTSAEIRFSLGDADAVSVGDYNLPELIGHALAGVPPEECNDQLMLELLAPYAGQRGRVIRLVELACARGLLPAPRRRGPRAAISQHRYW